MDAPDNRQEVGMGSRRQFIDELAAAGLNNERRSHYRLTEVPAKRAILMRIPLRIRRRGLLIRLGGRARVRTMMAATRMRVRRTRRRKRGDASVIMAVAHSGDHELHRLQSDREHQGDGLKASRHLRDLSDRSSRWP